MILLRSPSQCYLVVCIVYSVNTLYTSKHFSLSHHDATSYKHKRAKFIWEHQGHIFHFRKLIGFLWIIILFESKFDSFHRFHILRCHWLPCETVACNFRCTSQAFKFIVYFLFCPCSTSSTKTYVYQHQDAFLRLSKQKWIFKIRWL